MPTKTLAQLAQLTNSALIGDGSRLVCACNNLTDAAPDHISLLHNAKYAKEMETTRAACVVIAPGMARTLQRDPTLPPLAFLEAKNTYFAWQQIMVQLHGHRQHVPVGISPLASIAPSAKLGKNVHVHPFAVIGENVTVGDNTYLYPHVTLMHDSRVGSDTVLFPGVTVYEHCVVGSRCLINAGTVIGTDGTSFAQAGGIHHKMPQSGIAVIEDDVEIGANSIIERAALKTTRIGQGTKIGNLVVIGHNCQIGPGNMIISQVGMAGSTSTGKYVVMAGQVGVNGHLDIPDFVKIGAQAGVLSNPEPNTEIVGTPAMEANQAKRMILHMMHLPELAKRVKELERQLAKLNGGQ